MAKASSFHALKATESTTVGCNMSLPSNTPHVTAVTTRRDSDGERPELSMDREEPSALCESRERVGCPPIAAIRRSRLNSEQKNSK
eukprot:CAMPEP_0172055068 /NCGR_PEP_ID=MMETSP1043-20130122/5081_1 /TAXON_ID=464988 /ORGANISM="Hemiselmis andersenii, Strain CCMP441" /LENGTH=85 /DNA_ID=CAMNT_0012714437 /DNA_START=146 /DNA_END=403 /DNA_ORIENTATION=+